MKSYIFPVLLHISRNMSLDVQEAVPYMSL
jgi:hypothetical protein